MAVSASVWISPSTKYEVTDRPHPGGGRVVTFEWEGLTIYVTAHYRDTCDASIVASVNNLIGALILLRDAAADRMVESVPS